MKWTKKDNVQTAKCNGYEVIIEKSRRMYWATCHEIKGSAKVKKFVFPPRNKIKALKELVESNSLFEDIEVVQNVQPSPTYTTELVAEQWWQK